MKSSRALPLAAGAVLLLLVLVIVFGRGGTADEVLLDSVPQSLPPDADTPADTIKTLTARVSAMIAELEALRLDNEELREENSSIREQGETIEAKVLLDVTRMLKEMESKSRNAGRQDLETLERLLGRMEEFSEHVDQFGDGRLGHVARVDGWNDATRSDFDHGSAPNGYVWVPPSGRGWEAEATSSASALQSPTRIGAVSKNEVNRSVYTIPRNATLVDTRSLTALIGRVPSGGQVQDPMPFKVLTGRRNLIANGYELPEIEGMVWSGTAIGDWTLSCVSGTLESATFVFADGTVRTVPEAGAANEPIGWISDAHGLPCVPGARTSNVMGRLGSRMSIDIVEAAAQAHADAQTTDIVGSLAESRRSVTGDVSRFVLGETLASGSRELADWMASRASSEFDAVVVPANRHLAVHVDRELHIDITPNARRVNHERSYQAGLAGGVD